MQTNGELPFSKGVQGTKYLEVKKWYMGELYFSYIIKAIQKIEKNY